MEVNLIKISGKPLEKLIGVVSEGIGKLYKPRAIRKEADAKAYEIEVLAQANAKASLIKTDADLEIYERTKERLIQQEVARQINIENTIERSLKYLPDQVSETPVDPDWRTRFFNKVQDVSNEQLQDIWAKILAGEVSQPGAYSVRTLDVLSNLTQKEAIIFQKICSIAIFSSNDAHLIALTPIHISFGSEIFYGDILSSMEAGLLKSSGLIGLTQDLDDVVPTYSGAGTHFVYGGTYGNFVTIKHPTEKIISFNVYPFTQAGLELAGLIDTSPDMQYFSEIKTYFEPLGFIVKVLGPMAKPPSLFKK